MKAIWNDKVIAEAPQSELIYIEGNWYFPPDSVKTEYLVSSDTHTRCSWKGLASYYSLKVDDQVNQDAVWYYSEPMKTAFVLTKKDFSGYMAFWKGVSVVD